MKLLILTPVIPYPFSEGAKVSQYAIIDHLRNKCQIVLVFAVYSNLDEEYIDKLLELWPNVEIRKLYLKQTAAFVDSRKHAIKSLLRQGISKIRQITRLLSSQENTITQKKEFFETDNKALTNLVNAKERMFVNELLQIVNQVKPNIVQIELLNYIDLALIVPGGIKKVFVHHELSFARMLSSFSKSNIEMTPYDTYAIELAKKQECLFLQSYDGVFVFSAVDKAKLVECGIDGNKVYVTPFPVLNQHFQSITEANVEIEKLVFIGGESHSPNKDAVEWYINEIAKEINQVKKIVLHVVGSWSNETINLYKSNSNIHFAGYVENLIDYCKNSILLVPVRFGSGIRTKILYAMAQGIPVISTSIGSQGIIIEKDNIMEANSPIEFASMFKKVIDDSEMTINLVRTAQKTVKNFYSQEGAINLRLQYLTQVMND